MSRVQRIELLLFVATFFAFAYFHQGGGWNQNSRFAEVRAMVEEGRFAIDDFLIYQRDAASGELRPHSGDEHRRVEFDGQAPPPRVGGHGVDSYPDRDARADGEELRR